MEIILTTLIGLLAGLVIGFLAAQGKKHALQTQVKVLQAQVENEKAQAQSLSAAWQRQVEEVKAASREQAQALLDAQERRFDEAMKAMKAQVQAATDELLKQRQKEFAEQSSSNLGQIVTPLRETIDKMKKAMEDNTLKQTSMSSEMRTNIEHMMRQSQAAQKSAEELTRVFKHGGARRLGRNGAGRTAGGTGTDARHTL